MRRNGWENMKNFMYKSLLVLLCLCMALTVVGCSEEDSTDEKTAINLDTGIAYEAIGTREFTETVATAAGDEQTTDGEDAQGDDAAQPATITKTMDIVAKAGDYELLLDPQLGTIGVYLTSTDRFWKSNLDKQEVEQTIADLQAEYAAQGKNIVLEESDFYAYMSQLMLSYYDASNKEVTYNSYQFAILEESVEYYGLQSGLRMVYDIGQNVDDKLVPTMLTQEDYEALLEEMGENAWMFEIYYDAREYDTMDPTTRDSLKLEYSNFSSGDTYYQLGANSLMVKKEIYTSCLESIGMDFSRLETYAENCGSEFERPDTPRFTVAVDYTISENGLKVNLPTDKIQYEEGSFRLHQIQVLPYFGTITDGSDGTILIPDGTGALVDVNETSEAAVTLPFYGADNSLFTEENKQIAENAKNMQQATLPVYGVANGDNGFVTYVSSGEAVGMLECHPKYSYYRPYARVGGTFTIHPFEVFNSNGASSQAQMQKYASDPFTGNITLDYYFVTGKDVDYVDMATVVRNHVFGNSKSTVTDDSVRFYMETYGTVKRMENFLGYAYNKSVALTDLEQAQIMYDGLNTNGITNITVRYKNWYNDEYINKISNIGDVDGVLGSDKDFTAFMEYVQSKGGTVYANVELVMEKLSKSLTNATWHAKFIDGTMVNHSDMTLYSEGVTTTVDRIVVKSGKILKKLPNILEDLNDLSVKAVSLTTVGNQLFSDYTEDEVMYRESVKADMVSIMQQIKEDGKTILVDKGNAYALPYATDVMNVSLGCSNLSFEKTQVPFLPIVLHGQVSFAGSSLNLTDNYDMQLLKSVEYGANLAYTLNYAKSDMVKNTNYSELYSTNYDHWLAKATADYKRVAEVLNGCQTSTISDHTELSKGVYMTTYSNGVQVVVNYNSTDYTYQGQVIEAMNFARVSA